MIFRKKYSDEEIIAGLQSEDEKIRTFFENYLYKQYFSWIRHGQRRYYFTETESLDRYADAYMGLLKRIREGNFLKGKKIAPLFKTIFDNKCVDFIKKKTNDKKKDTNALEDVLELGSKAKSALEEVINAEFIAKIQQLLQEMTGNCPKIIHLWSQGYSHQNIAEMMAGEVSNANSSKAILSKCLKKLRGFFRK